MSSILLLAWLIAAVVAGPSPCAPDRAALLALPYETFNTQLGHGWRVVADRPRCEGEAADLIAAYRTSHASELVEGPPEDIRSLNWHEGQFRAAVGQTDRAILLLRKGSRESNETGDSYYERATIAFLKHDRAGVERARDQLEHLPKPAWFDSAAAQAVASNPGISAPTWPPHIPEVTGFLNCFDRPYAEAYATACRKTPPL